VKNKLQVSPYYQFPSDLAEKVEELDLGLESLFMAWEIAALAGDTELQLRRPLTILGLACLLAATEGHTRLPLADRQFPGLILNQIAIENSDREALWRLIEELPTVLEKDRFTNLAAVIGPAGSYRPLIYDQGSLYLQKYHLLEGRVSAALRERINWMPPDDGDHLAALKPGQIEEALQDVLQNSPQIAGRTISLDDEQQLAVKRALEGRITVVSGRPGSGKTAIVADLLRVVARLQQPPLEAIALAAPTGKAADRIRASIIRHLAAIADLSETDRKLLENCPPAQTLHRLLGYSPAEERFRHSARNPLAEKLIIVDESSMLDLALTDSLLQALQPDARLLLLGDADQLPPVDAGAVLRDLCRSKQAAARGRLVMLKNSYRAREEDSAGARILAFATALNSGEYPHRESAPGAPAVCAEPEALTFEGVEILTPREESRKRAFMEGWLTRHFGRVDLPALLQSYNYQQTEAGFDDRALHDLKQLFAHYENFKLLCVTRVTAAGAGSDFLNRWFHERWLTWLHDHGLPDNAGEMAVGEPLIVNRNDYRLGLYNGDSGIVLPVSVVRGTTKSRPEPMAVFQRGESFSAYPLQALSGRVEPAWAITVHKAQGSEYDDVAIILPDTSIRPLSRELLYTAVTRARRSVVIVGSAAVLEEGALRPAERLSGVTEILDAKD
jgi:exodeoxyribonuclease V alpha subunit